MRKTYSHHAPSESAIEKIRLIRLAFDDLHSEIEANCPSSRERSVALTEAETACMWAIKSIVINDPESKVESV